MGYVTVQEIRARYPEKLLLDLTDDARSGQINEDLIQVTIDEASSEIDAYAQARYTVPLPANDIIKKLCIDLAVYSLHARRNAVTETQQAVRERVTQFLRDLAAGKIELGITPPPSGTPIIRTTVVARPRLFGDDMWEMFA